MDFKKSLTVEEVDRLTVLQAMTVISDFCDSCLDCLECPFGRWDFENKRCNCILAQPPQFWRGIYGN